MQQPFPLSLAGDAFLPEHVRRNDAVQNYSSSLDNISHTETQDTTLIRLVCHCSWFSPATSSNRITSRCQCEGILGICEPILIAIIQFFHFFYRNLIELIASICSADNVVERKGKEANKCCDSISLSMMQLSSNVRNFHCFFFFLFYQ